eukprot:1015651-Rhodomonas_salina.1
MMLPETGGRSADWLLRGLPLPLCPGISQPTTSLGLSYVSTYTIPGTDIGTRPQYSHRYRPMRPSVLTQGRPMASLCDPHRSSCAFAM